MYNIAYSLLPRAPVPALLSFRFSLMNLEGQGEALERGGDKGSL